MSSQERFRCVSASPSVALCSSLARLVLVSSIVRTVNPALCRPLQNSDDEQNKTINKVLAERGECVNPSDVFTLGLDGNRLCVLRPLYSVQLVSEFVVRTLVPYPHVSRPTAAARP